MALDPKPTPPRGARLLAKSGQEANFLIYELLTKNPAAGEIVGYEDLSNLTSLGVVITATDGTKWLKVDAFINGSRYPNANYVYYDDRDITWVDLPTPLIPVPVAPTNLAVTVVSSTELSLSWVNPSGAVIEVERARTSNELPQKIISTGTNIVGYNDSNLIPNTDYVYRIRAVNDSGGSPYTELVGNRTKAIPPAPAPDPTPVPDVRPISVPFGDAQLASLQILGNLPFSPVTPAPKSWLEINLTMVLIGVGLLVIVMVAFTANQD